MRGLNFKWSERANTWEGITIASRREMQRGEWWWTISHIRVMVTVQRQCFFRHIHILCFVFFFFGHTFESVAFNKLFCGDMAFLPACWQVKRTRINWACNNEGERGAGLSRLAILWLPPEPASSLFESQISAGIDQTITGPRGGREGRARPGLGEWYGPLIGWRLFCRDQSVLMEPSYTAVWQALSSSRHESALNSQHVKCLMYVFS